MSQVSLDALFQPFELKHLKLKNRMIMAPMTRSFSPEGIPGADVAAYYRRCSSGGVGLILSEGTAINRPASRNDPNIPFFHGEAALAGWKRVIDGVHEVGGAMGPQIWHAGSIYTRCKSGSENGDRKPSSDSLPKWPTRRETYRSPGHWSLAGNILNEAIGNKIRGNTTV